MPMTSAGLSNALHTKLQSFFNIVDDTILKKFCDACGEAIVEYIHDNADVVPVAHSGENFSNASGQPVSITTGPGAGSTGATSADQELVGMGSIL